MVTISSPGLSSADVTDAVGSTANDGLTFDSSSDNLDVDTAASLQIDGNGQVDIVADEIKDTVGSTATDGLSYSSTTNELDVLVGSGLEIDTNGNVAIPTGSVEETALAYDFLGGI